MEIAEIILENYTLESALSYHKAGFSVIPLCSVFAPCWREECKRDGGCGKRPRISFKQFFQRKPNEEEIREWWGEGPQANIGLVTGEISNLFVIDVDGEEGKETIHKLRQEYPELEEAFSKAPLVQTGSGGLHFYFGYPQGKDGQLTIGARKLPGIDYRGKGGYIVAPPSLHASGRRYEWLQEGQPLPPPQALIELLKKPHENGKSKQGVGKEPGWVTEALQGVPKTQRNDTASRLAGHFFGRGLPFDEVLQLMLNWNQSNSPPLLDDEVERTVRSIREIHQRNHPPNGEVQKKIIAPIMSGELKKLEVNITWLV